MRDIANACGPARNASPVDGRITARGSQVIMETRFANALALLGSVYSIGCGSADWQGEVEIEVAEQHQAATSLVATGAICGWGVGDCSQCVHDVEDSLAQANASSYDHLHGRLGTNESDFLSNWVKHNQGMARLNHPDGRYIVLSRATSPGIFGIGFGHLLTFRMDGYAPDQGRLGSSGSHSQSNDPVWWNYDVERSHPDGLSVMGNFLIHGMGCEGSNCPKSPHLRVWDMTTPENATLGLDFDLLAMFPDVSLGTPASAAAAALVKLSNGKYMILFKTTSDNGKGLRVLQGDSLTSTSSWSGVEFLEDGEISAWDDDEFNYQHLSAVTECETGAIYLVATKGTGTTFPGGVSCGDTSEVARVFKLGTNASGYTLEKKNHVYFPCQEDDDVSFNAGVGMYVSKDGKMNFYASEWDYHQASSGYKVRFHEFWSGRDSDVAGAYGWAWAHSATGNYVPASAFSFNSSGAANRVVQTGTGRYRVEFPGLGADAGNVQVTAYGAGSERCAVASWVQDGSGELDVDVRCHTANGAPIDTRFAVSYFRPKLTMSASSAEDRGAFLWGNQPSTATYVPNPRYSWNSAGGTNSVTRVSTGVYDLRLPGMASVTREGGNAMVTAYGTSGEYCNVRQWLDSGTDIVARVQCFNAGGSAADSRYSFSYSASRGPTPSQYAAYAWANNATAASYTPDPWYSDTASEALSGVSESAARPQAARFGTGDYAVSYPFMPSGNTTIAHATAYGSTSTYCKVRSWGGTPGGSGTTVLVRCFNASGMAVDTRYVQRYLHDGVVVF